MAKQIDKATAEMRKLLSEKKLVVGRDLTLKGLHEGKLGRVMMASNCSDKLRGSLAKYCNQGKVDCVEMRQSGDELGIMCKKPFSISVIGVLK